MSTKNSMTTAIKNTKEAVEKAEALKVEKSMDKALENTKEYIKKHDYKLASHNTMSYLTPRTFLDRIIAFTARCQSKTIQEQIEKYGVKLVDLRFKFNKDDKVFFAHGAIEYKCDIHEILKYLNSFGGFPARVMLENKPGDKEEQFKAWCEYIENTYTNIKFFGGRNKWSWKQLYQFKNPEPSMTDKYSSCNTNEPGKPQTGTYLDDLYPKAYAKKNNRINLLNGTGKKYLMIDFVEIR